mgnify:CR=1 FL=1
MFAFYFFVRESQLSTFVFFIIFIVVVIIIFIVLKTIEIIFLYYTGPIGAATFHSAAASRPLTRAQPGEFHIIVHLRLVLLVLLNSSLVFT